MKIFENYLRLGETFQLLNTIYAATLKMRKHKIEGINICLKKIYDSVANMAFASDKVLKEKHKIRIRIKILCNSNTVFIVWYGKIILIY